MYVSSEYLISCVLLSLISMAGQTSWHNNYVIPIASPCYIIIADESEL